MYQPSIIDDHKLEGDRKREREKKYSDFRTISVAHHGELLHVLVHDARRSRAEHFRGAVRQSRELRDAANGGSEGR